MGGAIGAFFICFAILCLIGAVVLACAADTRAARASKELRNQRVAGAFLLGFVFCVSISIAVAAL